MRVKKNERKKVIKSNNSISKSDKCICFFAAIALTISLTACGNTDSKVNQVLEAQMAASNQTGTDVVGNTNGVIDEGQSDLEGDANSGSVDNASTENHGAADSENGIEPADNRDVDVDLTIMSSTMVLSEVSNMMVEPDSYMGKTVRMKGVFVNQIWNGQMYYACIIADATACCSQGLEFVPAGNLTFPDDFPELGSEITVVGEFSTYREDEFLYFTLLDAVIENVE